jgi:heterotetrameric sarcosine oxidase delta subunit
MGVLLTCPNCGPREYHEFWFGGEHRPPPSDGEHETAEANFERVWLRDNASGPQDERWFHFAGCHRWMTARRDTQTNQVLQAVEDTAA